MFSSTVCPPTAWRSAPNTGVQPRMSTTSIFDIYIYTVFLDFCMKCMCSCIYAICIRYIYIYNMCIDVLTTTKIWRSSHIYGIYIYRIPCRTCRFGNPDETTTFGKDQHGESENFRSGPFVGRRGILWIQSLSQMTWRWTGNSSRRLLFPWPKLQVLAQILTLGDSTRWQIIGMNTKHN